MHVVLESLFLEKIVERHHRMWKKPLKQVITMNHYQSVNWSDKVRSLDQTIRDEIGMEGENEATHILIKVQTKAGDPIEPAFIVGEDDTFLDLFVLSPQGHGIVSTAVLKDNIQSVGVIGGVSAEKADPAEIPEVQVLDDVGGLYQ